MSQPATRGDVHRAVQNFETALRGDIQRLEAAIRGEFGSFQKLVAKQIVRLDGRLDQMATKAEMNAGFSKVYRLLDALTAKVGKIDRAQVIADWQVRQLKKGRPAS